MKYSKVLEKYKKYFNDKLYKDQNILGVINLLNDDDIKNIKKFIHVNNYEPEIMENIKKDKVLFNKFSELSEEKKEIFYVFYKNIKFKSQKKNEIISNIKKTKEEINNKLNKILNYFNLNLNIKNLNFSINDKKTFEKNTKILEKLQEEFKELNSIIQKFKDFNSITKEEKELLNNRLKKKLNNIENNLNQIYINDIKIDSENFLSKIFKITDEEVKIDNQFIENISDTLKKNNLNENIKSFNENIIKYEEFIDEAKEEIIAETLKKIINQKFYLKIKKETDQISQDKINQFFKQKLNIDIKKEIFLQETLKNAIELKTRELINKIDNPNISTQEEMKHIIKNIENINLSTLVEEITSKIENQENRKFSKNQKNEINLFLRKVIMLKAFIDKYPLISMKNSTKIEKMEELLEKQNRITAYEKEILKNIINDFDNIDKNEDLTAKTDNNNNKILNVIDKSLNNFIENENNKEIINELIKEMNVSLLDSNIDIKSENEIFNEIITKYNINQNNINLVNKIKIEIQNYIKKRENLFHEELSNTRKKKENEEEIKEEFIQNINNIIKDEKIDSIYKLKKEFVNNLKKKKDVSLEKLLENIALETLLNEIPDIYSKIQSEFIKNNSFEFLSEEEKAEKFKIILNKEIKLLLDEKIKEKIQKNILQAMKELKPAIEKTNIYYVMNDEKILKKAKTENQFYNLLSEKVSSFFVEESYLSNLINLKIEEPFKNVLVNKQNLFDKNEKLNIKSAVSEKNNEIEEEIKNYITKTLFLKGRYNSLDKIINNKKDLETIKTLIDTIYKKIIEEEIGNKKFIDNNLIYIIKNKTLEIFNDSINFAKIEEKLKKLESEHGTIIDRKFLKDGSIIVTTSDNKKNDKKFIIYPDKEYKEIDDYQITSDGKVTIKKEKSIKKNLLIDSKYINSLKNLKEGLNNEIRKEINNNISAVTKKVKRLEIEKEIFQNILNLIQDLEIARKTKNEYWEKEINNNLIFILENNENLILEYAKENKILSKILKNENLKKEDFDGFIQNLKKNLQNNNKRSLEQNFQKFLELFDKNKMEENINKIDKVINKKIYFFNEKNNFLLKNINNLLTYYYLKKEKTKEAKILKKLYSNYRNYNNQNVKIDEFFKKNFSLLDEEIKTKFYFGNSNISYNEYIKKEEKKVKEQNFQTSIKHKTKLSDYSEIFFQFLSELDNKESQKLKTKNEIKKSEKEISIIEQVIKVLNKNSLSNNKDDFEQLNKIGKILKKSLILKYNVENEFLLNIENNMLQNVKDKKTKEKIQKGFEHFLTNSINEEIENLSKIEYLTDERIDISVQNIINTIKERLTNKNLKAIKIDNELIKLSDYQKIIGEFDYEKLRKHLFFVLKNSNNLKLKYNTLKIEGVDSGKFKKELIKLKKEIIIDEDLKKFESTNNKDDLKNLKNYIENIIINELATNKNKVIKLKDKFSNIKDNETSKISILSEITDEIIENFIRTNKIDTSNKEYLSTVLKDDILSEVKNDAMTILEEYYNNNRNEEENVNNQNIETIKENYFNKLFDEKDKKIPSNFKTLIEFYQYFKNYIEEKKEDNFQQEIYNSERKKNNILKELLKEYLIKNQKQILLNSFSTINFEHLYSNEYEIIIENQVEILDEILNYLNLKNLETEFESNLNANKILLNFKLKIVKDGKVKNIEIPIKLLKENIVNNILGSLEKKLKEEKRFSEQNNSSKYEKILKEEVKNNLKLYQEISKDKNKIYKKYEKNLIAEKYDSNNEKIINLLNKFNIDKHLINNYETINDLEHFNKSILNYIFFEELNGISYLFKTIEEGNLEKDEIKLNFEISEEIIFNNKENITKKEFNLKREYFKKENLLNINDNYFFLLKEKLKDMIFFKEIKYLDEKQRLNSDEYKILNYFQTNIDFYYMKSKEIDKLKLSKENKEKLKYNNQSEFLTSFLYNKEIFKQIQNLNSENEEEKLKSKLKIIDNIITSTFINLKFSEEENQELKNELLNIEMSLDDFKQRILSDNNIKTSEKNKDLDAIFKLFSEIIKKKKNEKSFEEINKFIILLEGSNKNNEEFIQNFRKKLLENQIKEKILFLRTIFNSNREIISKEKKKKINNLIKNITLSNFEELNENQLEIFNIEINNNIEDLLNDLKLQEINITKEEIILNSIKKARKKEDIIFQRELKKEFFLLLKNIKEKNFNKEVKTQLINFISLANKDFKFNFTVLFKKLVKKQIKEIENKINKIEKNQNNKELSKELETLKNRLNYLKNNLLKLENINETIFLKYLEEHFDDEFIYKNLFNTKMINNFSKYFEAKEKKEKTAKEKEFIKLFENKELEYLLNTFFSEKDIVAKKIDYSTNNVYSKKEGLYFLDIKGNSLNESSKDQYLNLNNSLLNNNIEILTWMKKNLTEKNEFYNKFNTVLEDDETTKWIIQEGQKDELNKYEKTNIYYLLENEKRIKLKKEKLNQILNEVEKEKLSFELIDEETNETKKIDIKVVDFLEMNNDNDEKMNFQKFKNYIVNKIGNLSIDETISNEVMKELENEGITEENYEIYWNEYKSKYKYKLEEKYKNLKEREKNGENIKEDLKKVENNIKEISKISNLSIDFDKLYSFYEQYHKIKKEIIKISNVEKKLEEKISDPTIIALIEFQILPEMIKNGYPEDIIRNMKKRIKKEKMKTDNIYRYSSIKNLETIEEAKKKLIEEINFLEENMGQKEGITKEKYNKRLTNLKKLYEEIETITMEGNVLDEYYIDRLNDKFKILLKENSRIEIHQLGRKAKKGVNEVTKETFNFTKELLVSIANQYEGFGTLLNAAVEGIVPKKSENNKMYNYNNKVINNKHQLNKRMYDEVKEKEVLKKQQYSDFELN